MAVSVTVRRAQLADRAAMLSLLTTKVAGTSPLDELIADFGPSVANYSLADAKRHIEDDSWQVAVALDAVGAVMRGWNLFQHGNALIGIAPDAWQSLYTVTDKNLVLADRLTVFKAMMRAAATQIPATTYIYGDVRTPGNLDTAIANFGVFTKQPLTQHGVACNRWYAPASVVLANF